MIRHLNRVLEVYRNWEMEESKLKSLNAWQSGEKEMLKAKYDYLSKGMYRVGIDPSVGEAIALGVMKGVLSRLEKQIYPNRFLRLLHQLKVALLDRPNYIDRFQKFKEENLRQVEAFLKSKDLDHYFGKLQHYLDYERPTVQIDFTASLDSNISIGFRINLEMNSEGGYEMESLHTTIRHSDQPEMNRHFDFHRGYDLNATKASNLLMGRAVLNGTDEFNPHNTNQWIQLEKVKAPDHYGIKVFQSEPGFDLNRALNDFAGETGIYRVTSADVVAQLQQGHQLKLSGRQAFNQPIFIEASPGTNGMLIRDKEQHLIGVDELLLGCKSPQEKEYGNHWLISNRNNDKSNQQDHSLGIGS